MMNPTLDGRFLPPAGWVTNSFVNQATGHNIHYGRAYPEDKQPTAIIIALGGLSEFTEKYYETAHDMLARGYAFWMMDWHYQGRSGRLDKTPQRRHSDGFNADVSDLEKFVNDYIVPATANTDAEHVPLVMLGHSMGGNIGLRYLAQNPERFDAAAFTAPLLGIHDFGWPMKVLAAALRPVMPLVGKNYIPKGNDWREEFRKGDGSDKFSTDPLRDSLHNIWSKTDPALQIGSPTLGWVSDALCSCSTLHKPGTLESITIPVLIAIGSREAIVDNAAIRAAAKRLGNGELIEIEGANHEILMESDQYRNTFLKAFDKMMERNKIASINTVKPF